MAQTNITLTVGRRKNSMARVMVTPGEGKISVNSQPMESFFAGKESLHKVVIRPLFTTETLKQFDIRATVAGGGTTGQAGAISLGIARALIKINPDLRLILSKAGLLRRDPRMVERKKYGQDGARKRFQFSKR